MIVAFDVDGILIDDEDQPRWPIIDMLRAFHALGWETWVWSGGGDDYARMWVNRLGLAPFVTRIAHKTHDGLEWPDVAVDDERATLGLMNLWLPLRPL